MSDRDYFMRPPEPDELPGGAWEPHPQSLRGRVIALYLETGRVEQELRASRRGRLLLRAFAISRALRRVARKPSCGR